MGYQGHSQASVDALSSFGFLYVSTPAATSITTGGTFVKAAGTTTAGTLRDFTHVDNRLTYIGAEARVFSIDVAVSMISSNNIITHWRIAKNGTTIAASEQQRLVGTGADVGNAGVQAEAELSTGDYIELFCTSDTGEDAKSITAQRMTLTVE